jgi:transcriptional regulator with XRE-family HTH domain
MDINKKIKKLCAERNWSVYTLALEAEITQSTLQSLLSRGTPPKIDTLQKLCTAFGITLSQFFNEDESIEYLTSCEKTLLTTYRQMSKEKQQALLNFIENK